MPSLLALKDQTDSITMPLSQVALSLTQHRHCLAEDLQGEHTTQQTGQLEGGFGQYRSQLDAGKLTPDQLRAQILVQLAYNRGEGGGQSGDYQYYLNTLGIDRSGNPFLQDDGTYANIAYGADLSQYQPDSGMPPPPPGGGGMPPECPENGGGMGRIPGQYITGNQLYSGLPYGMTHSQWA